MTPKAITATPTLARMKPAIAVSRSNLTFIQMRDTVAAKIQAMMTRWIVL